MAKLSEEASLTNRNKLKPRPAKWLNLWLPAIKAQSRLSDRNQMILYLAEKPSPTAEEIRDIELLINAAMLDEKAKKIANEEKRLFSKTRDAEKKARISEMCRLAELLQQAGLADPASGKALLDTEELFGALLEIAQIPRDSERRSEWRRVAQNTLNPPATATASAEEKTQEPVADFEF